MVSAQIELILFPFLLQEHQLRAEGEADGAEEGAGGNRGRLVKKRRGNFK